MEKKKGITLAVAAFAFSTIGLANLTVTKTSADEVKSSQTSSVQDLSQSINLLKYITINLL